MKSQQTMSKRLMTSLSQQLKAAVASCGKINWRVLGASTCNILSSCGRGRLYKIFAPAANYIKSKLPTNQRRGTWILCAQYVFRVTLTSANSDSTIQSGVQNASKWGASFKIPMPRFWNMATLTPLFWENSNFFVYFKQLVKIMEQNDIFTFSAQSILE